MRKESGDLLCGVRQSGRPPHCHELSKEGQRLNKMDPKANGGPTTLTGAKRMRKTPDFYSPEIREKGLGTMPPRRLVKPASDESGRDEDSWRPEDETGDHENEVEDADQDEEEDDEDEYVSSDAKSQSNDGDLDDDLEDEDEDDELEDDDDEEDDEDDDAVRNVVRGGRRSKNGKNPRADDLDRKNQKEGWKERKNKGLRELTALIDGHAQLHKDKRTRRRPSRRPQGSNSTKNDKSTYRSFSSGDSGLSGSSYLESSQHHRPHRNAAEKVTRDRNNAVKNVKMSSTEQHQQAAASEMDVEGRRASKKLSNTGGSTEGLSSVHVSGPSTATPRQGNANNGDVHCEGPSHSDKEMVETSPAKRQRIDASGSKSVERTDEQGQGLDNGTSHVEVKEEEKKGERKAGNKFPRMPMIQHGDAWYRARILKEDSSRIFVQFTGFEDGSFVKPFWISKSSERVFKGSYSGKDWKHLGDGAWQPKPQPMKRPKRQRGGGRGRRKGGSGGRSNTADVQTSVQLTARTKDSADQAVSQRVDTNMETDGEAVLQSTAPKSEVQNSEAGAGKEDVCASEEIDNLQKPKVDTSAPGPLEVVEENPKIRETNVQKFHKLPGKREAPLNALESFEPPRRSRKMENGERKPAKEIAVRGSKHEGGGVQQEVDADKLSVDKTGEFSSKVRRKREMGSRKGDEKDGKMGLAVSEGVASGGASQTSQAGNCAESSKQQGNRLENVADASQPDKQEKRQSAEGACSSPVSGSPGPKIVQREVVVDETDDNGDRQNVQGDGIRRSARVARLGWKGAWKRHREDAQSDGEDMGARAQTTGTSQVARQASRVITKQSNRSFHSDASPLHKRPPPPVHDAQPPTQKRSTVSRKDPETYAPPSRQVTGRHITVRSTKKQARTRVTRDRNANADELGTVTTGQGQAPGSGWANQSLYWNSGVTGLSHVRKHLPYYSGHIADGKLGVYVELMDRLDNVRAGNDRAPPEQQQCPAPQADVNSSGVSGANRVANSQQAAVPYVPIQLPQPLSSPQMPLPWTALSPLLYPTVVQFPVSMPGISWLQRPGTQMTGAHPIPTSQNLPQNPHHPRQNQ